MTVFQLCENIGLQPEIQEKVISAANGFDFRFVDNLAEDFYRYESARVVHRKLLSILREDPDHMKMLLCMLFISAATHRSYQEKGIPDEIYFSTMSCFPRFLEETYRRTGKWFFDRYWWTARQAGGHLFRIGQLEYEIKRFEGNTVIGIHIPSDADFSPNAVEDSFDSAKKFFKTYYPEVSGCDYVCHSWLLDQQLRGMLNYGSNILNFQNRFHVYDVGEPSDSFFTWVFQSQVKSYKALPENTSLQRNMKKHLLAGGRIHDSYGRLKGDPDSQV